MQSKCKKLCYGYLRAVSLALVSAALWSQTYAWAQDQQNGSGQNGWQDNSMSGRMRKYMDDGGGTGGADSQERQARRERFRQRLMQMPEGERQAFIEQMKQRRMRRAQGMGPGAGPGQGRSAGPGAGQGMGASGDDAGSGPGQMGGKRRGQGRGRGLNRPGQGFGPGGVPAEEFMEMPNLNPPPSLGGMPNGPMSGRGMRPGTSGAAQGLSGMGPRQAPGRLSRPGQSIGSGQARDMGPGQGAGIGGRFRGDHGPNAAMQGAASGPMSDRPPVPMPDRGGARRAERSLKGAKFFGGPPLDLTILNLTADQKQKIMSLRQENAPKARQLQGQLKQRRQELKDMMFDPSATREGIMAKRSEIRDLQNQAEDLTMNDFLGIRGVLTKDQLQLLPQLRPQSPAARAPGANDPKDRPAGGAGMNDRPGKDGGSELAAGKDS